MKFFLIRYFILVLGFVGSTTFAASQVAEEPVILYEQDPTLLTTNIQIVVRNGGNQDPPDRTGISDLLADMMLRGTKKKSRSQFQSEVELLGGSLGGGATQEYLLFSGTVIKENTLKFLDLVEECLESPAFSEKEFAALKKERIKKIIHDKNSNGRLAGLALRKVIFEGSFLERSVTGGLKSMEKISLKDLITGYNKKFNRESIVFAVSSPHSREELTPRLKKIWLKFPKGKLAKEISIPPKVPTSPKIVVVHKPKTSTGTVLMAQPGITAKDPLLYPLGMGNFAFGGEPLVSRLFKVIRGELGWTYAIGSTYHAVGPLTYQQGLFMVSTTPSIEFTVKTIFKTVSMWKTYYEEGLKPSEFALAEKSLVNSYPFEFDTADKRLSQKVTSYLFDVPVLSPEEYAARLDSVTNKSLLEALKERQSPSQWWIVIVADKNEIQKQLAAEQQDVPAKDQIKIDRIISPDEAIS